MARGPAASAVDDGEALQESQAPPRKRGGRPKGDRREVIMREAARLFFERGYHATWIDDIGVASGITGPAVYRHFKSKEDLLVALIDESADRAAADIKHVHEQGGTPTEMFERLVRCQVRLAIEGAALLMAVTAHELRELPAEERLRLVRRDRLNREEWVHLLAAVRPDLDDAEVRTTAVGVIEFIRALATAQSGLDSDRLERLIVNMVLPAVGITPTESRTGE